MTPALETTWEITILRRCPKHRPIAISTVRLLKFHVDLTLAWFEYTSFVHGFLHRPTFQQHVAALPTASYEFLCLYHAVLGLGASILLDTNMSSQLLQKAWAYMTSRLYNSQSLHAVQGTHLLVDPFVESC